MADTPADTPFAPVPTELDFPRYEREVLELWRQRGIFEKSLAHRGKDAQHFVFYEGPPTANGVPHNGHVLTRVMKDLFPRYQSMLGKRVLRKGGWDTHGLPVEVEVEKELRIHGKEAIVEYGVEPFVARCIESVFRYTDLWERLTERLGFWVSLPDAYVTYHKSYVESVWWALGKLFEKGLLYRGHKVVWWWAQGGTALSSAEVGLGYKTVDDPSVYVEFPLVDEPDTALVVWTTTPWTLPSNGYAAVKGSHDHVVCTIGAKLAPKEKKKGKAKQADSDAQPPQLKCKKLIFAAELRETLEQKLGFELVVEKTLKGSDLVGARYRPPFDYYYGDLGEKTVALKDGSSAAMYWRVIDQHFVTLDSGTGIVHVAPAFGEDDHNAHRQLLASYADPDSVPLICAIHPDGTFTEEAGDYAGRWVKDADKDITRELADKQLLVHDEVYRHEYPFCWRADQDPLIQMARPAWFIRTTSKIDRAIENNRAVNWLPEHIQEGRFGDFLQNNVDWALSRERFWGTPLNVWVCENDPEVMMAPASVEEILELNPNAFDHWHEAKKKDPSLNDHLMVHKPWIDEVTFEHPEGKGLMRRVPEVIDCWFDSGCMPFAQWGFPHAEGSKEKFHDAFPADFISEAIDQTRGWFYSLLMISTLVFDEQTQAELGLDPVRPLPHPYKTCIVLGHVGDREGKKESKSKGNYTPPEIILDRVRMEFGVLSEVAGQKASVGEAWIARDDLDGMDLQDGAEVVLYRMDREDRADERRAVKLKGHKKLPRRVIVLSDEDRIALDVIENHKGNVPPVEVPRLPQAERIVVEDPNTPAPGADAFRWFFYASNPPWNNTRHSLRNVKTLQKDFQVKLRNVYSFFTIYANIDGWRPTDAEHAGQPREKRSRLDRWMLSELALTVRDVREALDAYRSYEAAQRLIACVDALSNWYVRRSRARFWGPGLEPDKRDAYATLYEVLSTLSELIAPLLPFFGEEMYQNLVARVGVEGAAESVHLADYPEPDESAIDEQLAAEMQAVRDVVSLGLSVRTANKLKVRQPLHLAEVVFNDGSLMQRLERYESLIKEELNVHELKLLFSSDNQDAVSFKLKPNFRALGPRLGKRVQAVKKALEAGDGNQLMAELSTTGKVGVDLDGERIELSGDELDVVVEAAEGFAAETGKIGVVILETTLTDELVDEGYLRELVSRVQAERKDLQLDYTDRVVVRVGGSERLRRVAQAGSEQIRSDCLATTVQVVDGELPGAKEASIADEPLMLSVTKA